MVVVEHKSHFICTVKLLSDSRRKKSYDQTDVKTLQFSSSSYSKTQQHANGTNSRLCGIEQSTCFQEEDEKMEAIVLIGTVPVCSRSPCSRIVSQVEADTRRAIMEAREF